jgi:hypothetical protein
MGGIRCSGSGQCLTRDMCDGPAARIMLFSHQCGVSGWLPRAPRHSAFCYFASFYLWSGRDWQARVGRQRQRAKGKLVYNKSISHSDNDNNRRITATSTT